MAVSFVAASAAVNAAASITPTLPTGSASGDRVFVGIVSSPPTTATSTPTGWTKVVDASLGTGTVGASTGARRITIAWRDYDGSWTMPSWTVTSGSVMIGSAATFRKSATEVWDTSTVTSGSDTTTTGTGFSVTGAANLNVSTGDMIFAVAGTPANGTATTPTLTATGATIANLTEQIDTGVTLGNNAGIKFHTANVTAGTSTAAPVHGFTFSVSGSSSGGAGFVRIRATTPLINDTISALSGVIARYRADQITGLASGAAVSSWPNAQGPAGAATQATAGLQPTWQAGVMNGQPTVRFDGTDDRMTVAASGSAQPLTVLAVVNPDVVNDREIIGGGVELLVNTTWNGWGGTTTLVGPTATAAQNTAVIFIANGATSTVRVTTGSGQPVTTTGTTGTTALSASFTVGSTGSARFWDGEIAELVIFSQALSASDLAVVDSYVGSRYGIGVAATASSLPLYSPIRQYLHQIVR